MTDKIADELPDARTSLARALGRGCEWAVDGVLTQFAFDGLAIVKASVLDAKDKRIAELEAALDDALDTILEHILADSSPVTKEDQPAIEAFDRAVEEGRARLASRLLNKEDRNG